MGQAWSSGTSAGAGPRTGRPLQQGPELGPPERCRGAIGAWCGVLERSELLLIRPLPRGDTACPADCSGQGNCDYSYGLCMCAAGWTGVDCSTPQRRPCTNRIHNTGNITLGHIDADGRDLNWTAPGYTFSRCAGICDDSNGACYCDGALGKHGRINAPRGSPYGTPPLQRGRPLGDWCQPITMAANQEGTAAPRVLWGTTPYANIYGPTGWCVADVPEHICGCAHDGLGGLGCEHLLEQFCPSQCSGHGECNQGFCLCHSGWYGVDCVRKRAGQAIEPALGNTTRPWIAASSALPLAARVREQPAGDAEGELPLMPGAAAEREPHDGGHGGRGNGPLRRRGPLIYVYELPPEFNTRLLQYRLGGGSCTHRQFHIVQDVLHNVSVPNENHPYPLETYLHEVVLQSPQRTFHPEEADYFWVPLYYCCLMFPVTSHADHPWFGAPIGMRPLQVAHLMLDAKRWLQKHHPWWDRRGGRDHIWLTTHDEGACYMPSEIYNTSVVLTQWGRMDLEHSSGSAYHIDNYTKVLSHLTEYLPQGDWRVMFKGHPCYNSTKDLVIPHLKWPKHYRLSPLLGTPPLPQRDVLLFFRGDVGKHRQPWYSRGIRQGLYKLAQDGGWRRSYNICIGDKAELPGEYSEWLRRSTFCLVAPGDGYSARAEDAVLHGCIPVVIQDNVHAPFETLLDYSTFALRFKQSELAQVPDLLRAVTLEGVKAMQEQLTHVWHRFGYTSGRWLRTHHRQAHAKVLQEAEQAKRLLLAGQPEAEPTAGRHPGGPKRAAQTRALYRDDAWHTILQWLAHRIPHTR